MKRLTCMLTIMIMSLFSSIALAQQVYGIQTVVEGEVDIPPEYTYQLPVRFKFKDIFTHWLPAHTLQIGIGFATEDSVKGIGIFASGSNNLGGAGIVSIDGFFQVENIKVNTNLDWNFPISGMEVFLLLPHLDVTYASSQQGWAIGGQIDDTMVFDLRPDISLIRKNTFSVGPRAGYSWQESGCGKEAKWSIEGIAEWNFIAFNQEVHYAPNDSDMMWGWGWIGRGYLNISRKYRKC